MKLLDQCSLKLRKCDDLVPDLIAETKLGAPEGADNHTSSQAEDGPASPDSEALSVSAGDQKQSSASSAPPSESCDDVGESSNSCFGEATEKPERDDSGVETSDGSQTENRRKRSAAQLASARLFAALPVREKRSEPDFPPKSAKKNAKRSFSTMNSGSVSIPNGNTVEKKRPGRTPKKPEPSATKVLREFRHARSKTPPAVQETVRVKTPTKAPGKHENARVNSSPSTTKVKRKSPKKPAPEESPEIKEPPKPLLCPLWRRDLEKDSGIQPMPGVFAVKSKPNPPAISFPIPPIPNHVPVAQVPANPIPIQAPFLSEKSEFRVPFPYQGEPMGCSSQGMCPPYAAPSVPFEPCWQGCSCSSCLPVYQPVPQELPIAKIERVFEDEKNVLNWHTSHRWMDDSETIPPSWNSLFERPKPDDFVTFVPEKVERVLEEPKKPGKMKDLPVVPQIPFMGIKRSIHPIFLGAGEVRCSWCLKVVKKVSYRQHVKTWHRKVGSYSCGMCGEGFLSRAKAEDHLKVHSDPQPDSGSLLNGNSCASFDGFASNDAVDSSFWTPTKSETSDEASNSCSLPVSASGATAPPPEVAAVEGNLVCGESVSEVTNSSNMSDDVPVSQNVDSLDAWESSERDPCGIFELLCLEEEGILTPASMFPLVHQVASSELDLAVMDADVREYLLIDPSSINVLARQIFNSSSVDFSHEDSEGSFSKMAVLAAVIS